MHPIEIDMYLTKTMTVNDLSMIIINNNALRCVFIIKIIKIFLLVFILIDILHGNQKRIKKNVSLTCNRARFIPNRQIEHKHNSIQDEICVCASFHMYATNNK